jgi:hypothetical protein
VAPRHDHLVAKIGDTERPLIDVISRPTAVMDIVGVPALTIPVGFDALELPLGMQIAGRPHQDGLVLSIAHMFQSLSDHHRRLPPIVQADRGDAPSDRKASSLGSDTGGLASSDEVLLKPLAPAIRDRVW